MPAQSGGAWVAAGAQRKNQIDPRAGRAGLIHSGHMSSPATGQRLAGSFEIFRAKRVKHALVRYTEQETQRAQQEPKIGEQIISPDGKSGKTG